MSGGSAEPGLFGKLPTHGDFITRRLPRGFLDTWDAWLQAGVAGSRAELGEERWLEVYLTAPVWCFALEPGVCGPQAWAGVLLPSVDRVGRYFPLTLAVGLPTGVTPLQVAAGAGAWFDRACGIALDALAADEPDLDGLDRRVADLGPIGLDPSPGISLPVMSGVMPGLRLPLSAAGPAVLAQQLLDGWIGGALSPYSLWWTDGSERVEPSLLWSRQLPPAATFAELLTGRWSSDHWLESGMPASAPPSETAGARA